MDRRANLQGQLRRVAGRLGPLLLGAAMAVVAGALVTTVAVKAASSLTWESEPSMPTPRLDLGAATTEGLLYAIGGWNHTVGGSADILATTEYYDPVSNHWATAPSMPTARYNLGVVAANGYIFAIGGLGPNNSAVSTVEAYNPLTNSWSSRASMPTLRDGFGVVAASNGKIYAIGGYWNAEGGQLDTVEAYDPIADSWSTLRSMPTRRDGLSAAEGPNGLIYAIGGFNGSNNVATVEVYDPATDTWSERTPMPIALSRFAAVTLQGKIYAIGGEGSPSGVEVYDPATDTWATDASMPTPRYMLAAAVLNNKIYAVGGLSDSQSTLATVEAATSTLVDTTPPTTTATLSPIPDASGWNNSNVMVTLSATDDAGGSGVQSITCSASGAQTIPTTTVLSSTAAINITTEGQTIINYFATDNAGNQESTKTITIKLDKTPPTLTFGTSVPAANAAGWNNTDVSIPFTATDNLSGVAASNPISSPLMLTTEGAVMSSTVVVTDVAGNSATFTSPAVKIDKTPPSITISQPTNGAVYTIAQAVPANYSCNDPLSGVASCAGSVALGANIDTGSVGVESFAVNAADNAGNLATNNVVYTVTYGISVLYDQTKAVQSGSTIPIKLQLVDANGNDVSYSNIVVNATGVTLASNNAPGVLQDSGNANPDNNFRYDSTLGSTGGYIYNLSTKGLGTGTYNLSFTVGNDPITHTVQFQVK